MASRTSSSRGRGRGKSKIDPSALAITTSNTGTQSGPSIPTQHGKQSGSSSQKTQGKQTKESYAFPVQTLLALQEQGLTKLPSRTWASIADDSDQEISDLELAIQASKNQSLQINPNTKDISAQTQTLAITQKTKTFSPAQTQYIPKESLFFLVHLEPEFWDNNPNKISSKIFPPQTHFHQFQSNKTQNFYEFILVDTESVSVKHYRDPKDESFITHSTLQILKVLTPSDFGQNPNISKRFSQLFDPMGYNYWDYIKAWDYVILGLQNKNFKHSWLIYFKRKTKYAFPNWFLQWWDFFGPVPEILPVEVQEGFQSFSKRFNKELNNYPIFLNFCTIFSLSWIISWQYKVGNFQKPQTLKSFYKQILVKWWQQFDASSASQLGVTNWFKSNPKALQVADSETCKFLNQKARIAAALAGSTSEDDVLEKLQNIMHLLQSQSRKEDIPSSSKPSSKGKETLVYSPSSKDSLGEDCFDYFSDDDLC